MACVCDGGPTDYPPAIPTNEWELALPVPDAFSAGAPLLNGPAPDFMRVREIQPIKARRALISRRNRSWETAERAAREQTFDFEGPLAAACALSVNCEAASP